MGAQRPRRIQIGQEPLRRVERTTRTGQGITDRFIAIKKASSFMFKNDPFSQFFKIWLAIMEIQCKHQISWKKKGDLEKY